MNAQIRKEIRLLLPAWGAAMALGVIFFSAFAARRHVHLNSAWFVFASEIGAVLLGVAVFGRELASGTLAGMLAQPVSRLRMWNLKMQVLAVAFLTSGALVVLVPYLKQWGNSDNSAWFCAMMLTAAVTTGLWTTLLLRHLATAFWLTLLMPWFVVSAVQTARQLSHGISDIWETLALAAYSLAGYILARRLFLRAQDTQWTGGTVLLPTLPFPAWTGSAGGSLHWRSFRALLRKEIHSHQSSLYIAALLLALHLAAILVRKYSVTPLSPRDTSLSGMLLNFVWLLWFGMPLVIGCETIAEERKMGTLTGQLCLPVRQRAQFFIKFAVALSLGIVLGGVFPALLEGLFRGNALLPASFSMSFLLVLSCSVAMMLALVSMWASSLSRSLMQAMGIAVVAFLLISGVLLSASLHGSYNHWWSRELFLLIVCPLLGVMLVGLAWSNYRRLHPGVDRLCHNIVILAATMCVALASTYLIWNRAWEWCMNLEPKHGPARLDGNTECQMIWTGQNAILLPDGRLWMGQLVISNDMPKGSQLGYEGCLVGGSNWTQISNDPTNGILALKTDGTLWNVSWSFRLTDSGNESIVPVEHQIGKETDWRFLCGYDQNFGLVFKNDGAIWWFGRFDLDLHNSVIANTPTLMMDNPEIWKIFTNVWPYSAHIDNRNGKIDPDYLARVLSASGSKRAGTIDKMLSKSNWPFRTLVTNTVPHNASRYSDWICAENRGTPPFNVIRALASDGTLSIWDPRGLPFTPGYPFTLKTHSLLGPSRKPYCMNILDAIVPAPVPAITNAPDRNPGNAPTRKTP